MLEDIDKITTPGEKKPTNVKKILHKKEVSAMKTEKMIWIESRQLTYDSKYQANVFVSAL